MQAELKRALSPPPSRSPSSRPSPSPSPSPASLSPILTAASLSASASHKPSVGGNDKEKDAQQQAKLWRGEVFLKEQAGFDLLAGANQLLFRSFHKQSDKQQQQEVDGGGVERRKAQPRFFWCNQELTELCWCKPQYAERLHPQPTSSSLSSPSSSTAATPTPTPTPPQSQSQLQPQLPKSSEIKHLFVRDLDSVTIPRTAASSNANNHPHNNEHTKTPTSNDCKLILQFRSRNLVLYMNSVKERDEWAQTFSWLLQRSTTVGQPFNVQHLTHVDQHFIWSDPAEVGVVIHCMCRQNEPT